MTHAIASEKISPEILKPEILNPENLLNVVSTEIASTESSRSLFSTIGSALHWLSQAQIIRQIGPNSRPLERHEFESVEARRGGFGNVF